MDWNNLDAGLIQNLLAQKWLPVEAPDVPVDIPPEEVVAGAELPWDWWDEGQAQFAQAATSFFPIFDAASKEDKFQFVIQLLNGMQADW